MVVTSAAAAITVHGLAVLVGHDPGVDEVHVVAAVAVAQDDGVGGGAEDLTWLRRGSARTVWKMVFCTATVSAGVMGTPPERELFHSLGPSMARHTSAACSPM